MEVLALYERLVGSELFKEWRRGHKSSYLCSFFRVFGERDDAWEVSFYDEEGDVMDTFSVGEKVKLAGEGSRVFKEAGARVEELNVYMVDVDVKRALGVVDLLVLEKYARREVLRRIVILQRLQKRVVWNVTYMTKDLQLVQVKVDAGNGRVVEDSMRPALGVMRASQGSSVSS